MTEQPRPAGMPAQGVRAAGPPPSGWVPGRPPVGGRPAGPGVAQLLGPRRELVAWLLTAAAAAVLVGRVLTLFAYPAIDGLRLNAVTVGPGLAALDLVGIAVVAALLAVAAESTPKSRLIVLIDLLVLALTGILALIGLGLTLAAYRVGGIGGLVSGAVLVQVGNLLALVVAGLVVQRALGRTPRPSGRSATTRDSRPTTAAPQTPGLSYGRRPPYGPGAPYRPGAPHGPVDQGPPNPYGPGDQYRPASPYGPGSPYGQPSQSQRPMPDRQAPDGSGDSGR